MQAVVMQYYDRGLAGGGTSHSYAVQLGNESGGQDRQHATPPPKRKLRRLNHLRSTFLQQDGY